MKVIIKGENCFSVGGLWRKDYEIEYSNKYKAGDIIDAVLINHKGGNITKDSIKLEVNEELLEHIQLAYEETLEEERRSKLPKKYIALYRLSLASDLIGDLGQQRQNTSLYEMLFDQLDRADCPQDDEEIEDYQDRLCQEIDKMSAEEIKNRIWAEYECLDNSYSSTLEEYLKDLKVWNKIYEDISDDEELDDEARIYLKLYDDNPNEYCVKIFDSEPNDTIINDNYEYDIISIFEVIEE